MNKVKKKNDNKKKKKKGGEGEGLGAKSTGYRRQAEVEALHARQVGRRHQGGYIYTRRKGRRPFGSERSLPVPTCRKSLVEKWQTRWRGEQTGRSTYRQILELATRMNRKHGEFGFYLAQVLSGHGCFNAYLRRFKKRDEEMCRYCDTPVDSDPRTWELAAPTIDASNSLCLPHSTNLWQSSEEEAMSWWGLWWGPPAPTFWDHCLWIMRSTHSSSAHS